MTALQVSAQKRLREHVDALERLQEEQRGLAADIRDRLAEAKGEGFDVKVIRKLLAIRRKSKAEYEEEQAILEVYLDALGLGGTPLGDYAVQQVQIEAREKADAY